MAQHKVRLAIAPAIIFAAVMLMFTIGQETPVGAVKGRVVAKETGKPLVASIYLTSVASKDTEDQSYHLESKADGTFDFGAVPAGAYNLAINSKAHKMPLTRITVEESRTRTIDAKLAPVPPYLNLYIHQHIFTPDEMPQVTCRGFMKATALDLSLYKVDLDAFLATPDASLGRMLGVDAGYDDSGTRANVNLGANKALTLAKTMRVDINSRDLEGIFTQRVDLPLLAPGLYVASIKADGIQQLGWLMVTSIGLVSKTAGTRTLAYAVDLKTGAPIAGAQVAAYVDSKVAASGTTASDGTANLTTPAGDGGGNEQMLVARKGDSAAFVSSWYEAGDHQRNLIYTYTDRPVYRPGQKVFFKGIVRRPTDDGYDVSAAKPVSIEVRDSRDTLIFAATKRTDRFGAYYGSFDLNAETATGFYYIATSIDGVRSWDTANFQVAAYKKPEFSVTATFAKKRYVRGDVMRANVSAQYYFGAPVPNAAVHYVIKRADYWLFTGDEEEFMDSMDGEGEGYSDYGGYGQVVAEGDVTTDANGNAVVETPATWPKPEPGNEWETDQQFSIEATVTDRADRTATGNASVVATRGTFALDVTTDRYVVLPGDTVDISVQAMDYDKRPVKRTPVDVVLFEMKWNRGRSTRTVLTRTRVTTDDAGRATLPMKISRAGDLRVEATATDPRGNKIVGNAWIWSYSDAASDMGGGSFPDLQVVMDKREYKPGDTAKVLINTKTPGATALVTVEGSRIYDSLTVPLTKSSTLVEIPIEREYKPNFYVNVCFVKNKEFASQQARARVSISAETLDVRVTPDKKTYKPGETAVYTVKATDATGRPAVAQLSVGVVDEAIYAIAKDETTPILGYFYARKPNSVQTNFSFPQIYLSDPDKAGAPLAKSDRMGQLRVRKRFLDTAFWAPDVVTDSRGTARVSVKLPDNLTTWRTTVRGITADTRCGESKSTVVARQDFMVRLETPRFLIQSDNAGITTVVHNYTSRDQDVNLTLTCPGLRLAGSAQRSVRVAKGAIARVDWRVTADMIGDVDIAVKAAGDSAGDAMQVTIPAYPHGAEKRTEYVGEMRDSGVAKKSVVVRSDAITPATVLNIRLAPSLASTMLASLDFLAQYPYGCTEQTTSSFLPDVIIARSFKSLGVTNPEMEKRLPDMVQKGLLKLYRFQNENGAWGWSEYGEGDPWMTAYVVFALIQARDAGFAVNGDILDTGVRRLTEMLGGAKVPLPVKAYGYYVLALAGSDVRGKLDTLAASKWIDNGSLANLALAYQRVGAKEKANEIVGHLFDRATRSGDRIYWTGDARGYVSEVETTAVVLQAVIKANPNDPRAVSIVRSLMDRFHGDRWYSTRDTAMSLYAMADFLAASKELTPDYTVAVYVNSKLVGRKHFTRADIFKSDAVISVPARVLRKGTNTVEVRKSGAGNLYFAAELTQFVEKDLAKGAVSATDVRITREYYRPSAAYYEDSSEKSLGRAVSGCRVGDIILVRLKVSAKEPASYVLVEDTIPAGCEIIDRGSVSPWDWYNWWVGQDVRDEKISFYVDYLPAGENILTYQMRAGFRGEYHAMPAQAFGMYDPSVRTYTAEKRFSIR